MNNVIMFEQSNQYHAAVRHVLGLALEKAIAVGAIDAQRAQDIREGARTRCDVGECRRLTEQVLVAWQNARKQRKELPNAQG